MSVKATMHSDDYVFECKFDATPWFEQASPEDVVALSSCDWGGDYPADSVGQFCEDRDRDIEMCLEYVRRKDQMGFEVQVDEESAREWLKTNRPAILELL